MLKAPRYLASFGGTGANVDQKTEGNLVFLAEALSGPPGEALDTRIFMAYDVANNNPQLLRRWRFVQKEWVQVIA